MANQQKIRLVDCFYEPTQVFSLYDYTKIIYPVDGYICMKEITIPDSQPNFIKLEHEYDKIHALLTYPNLIVSLQQTSTKQFMLGFYDSIHLHTKLSSSLAEEFKKVYNPSINEYLLPKKLQFKIKNSSGNIFILFSLKNQSPNFQLKDFNKTTSKQTISLNGQESHDNELIVVNLKSNRIVSRNYFSGNVKELFVKNNDAFSFLFEDSSLMEYQLYENLTAKQGYESLYMMKKSELEFVHANPKSKHQISSHIWLKEELILMNQSFQELCIYVQGKKCQSISLENVKSAKILWPLMCGFLICNQNFMYIYKKVELEYVCIAEFFVREIGFSPELILSPQEDILAYFMNSNKSILYINNFCQEVQNQLKVQKKHTKQLKKSGSIEFKKDSALRIDVNRRNNTFALTHQSTIQLYSISNFEMYLEQSVVSQQVSVSSPVTKGKLKRMNTLGAVQGLIQNMGKQQTILKVAIHPHNQLLAIALKSRVRIYQILFSELSHVKDILVTNCSEMFYSNSGQFLSLVVSGKNGSKCYVSKTNEDYELIECLSIGKKIERFVWSKYDNYLYGVYSNGYYRWGIETRLKSRFQTLFDIPFPVIDAILNDQKDILVLYGEKNVLEVNEKMNQDNQLNPKDIIKVNQKIKQMVYQNGSYFLNVNGDSTANQSSIIVKCDELSSLDSQLKDSFYPVPQHLAHLKQPTTYRQPTGQVHEYQMFVCSGDQKRNVIILIEEVSKNIKVLEWGKNSNNQAKVSKNTDLVKIDHKNLRKIFKKYAKYEDEIKALQQNMLNTIEQLKGDLMQKQKERQKTFLSQIQVNEQKYEKVKVQKQKLEHTIQQKIEKHEEKTIKEVKQIEKMYERKIAITTNKLLTSQEINYRNMLLAQENLKKLERQANNDVQKIREQYKKQLAEYMSEKDNLAEQVYKVKKEYESRLYDLEQENERILQRYQSKSEDNQNSLRRNLVSWEIKYSEAVSKKDNLEKALQQAMVTSQILKEKIGYYEAKNRESNKKSEYLMVDIQKYEKILQEKNTSIVIYEERINDLEKSNEILKYRVIELKGETEPQSEQNLKLRENLNELETEYDKIVKSAFQKEQMLSIVKKQSEKSKETVHKLQTKAKRIQKSYLDLLDKVLNITKAPIQQIRKQLISLLNSTKQDEKYLNRPTSSYARSQSPLGELNRIREHLESCLHEAVDSNKKNEQQKKVQMLKKNRQNSQLIKEINDLRRKVREMQAIIKDKDLQNARLIRGDPIAVNDLKGQKENTRFHFHSSHEDENQKEELLSMNFQSNNEKQISRSQTRKQTRQTKESFFDKSLFKSGQHWREKRLKTEHSQHRNVNTRSVKRNPSGKYLQIDQGSNYEDIEDLRRMVDQKETIIKQLINKIQSLS